MRPSADALRQPQVGAPSVRGMAREHPTERSAAHGGAFQNGGRQRPAEPQGGEAAYV